MCVFLGGGGGCKFDHGAGYFSKSPFFFLVCKGELVLVALVVIISRFGSKNFFGAGVCNS